MDDRKEIFVGEYSDTAYSERDDVEGCCDGEATRYVREDLCFEPGENDVILKHLPLFGCHADSEGNVWVKIVPLRVEVNE